MDKMDWIEIRQKLEEKSKSEILDIVEKLIHEKPGIVTSMNYLLNRTEEDPIIDMFSIESRIDDAIYGDLDYYHLDDALNKLYEVQHSAQSLQKKHHWKNAAEIYFKLIDASIEAYESGADDSSGSLGWFTQDCIKAFNECTKNIDDQEYNTGFVKSVLELIFREDYGMEPEKMLENIVTSENIGMIEEELKDDLHYYKKKEELNFHENYKYQKMKDLLASLYTKVGMLDKAQEFSLQNLISLKDYENAAQIALEGRDYKKAVRYITKAVSSDEFKEKSRPFNSYFKIIEAILNSDGGNNWEEIIDRDSVIAQAFTLIETWHQWSFDPKKYLSLCNLLARLKLLDKFRNELFQKETTDQRLLKIILLISLEEGKIQQAVEKYHSLSRGAPSLALRIAYAAESCGKIEISREMGISALKDGISNLSKRDIKLYSSIVDEETIQKIVKIGTSELPKEVLIPLTEIIAKTTPGLVKELHLATGKWDADQVLALSSQLREKASEASIKICESWIHERVVRSHVYYDDAIRMLKFIKKAKKNTKKDSEEWDEFLTAFKKKYQTRKKLMNMIESADL